jgi:hypothetical protein
MNKLSLPPQRNKQPTEAEIEAVINKGGSPVPTDDTDPQTLRHVSARLTDEIIREIDTLRAARPRKMGSPKMGVSLRDWIVEAVMEKLERDRRKLGRGSK